MVHHCLFLAFSNKQNIFKTNSCKNYPSSIRCRDSNSRPLEHQSPPIPRAPTLIPTWICFFRYHSSKMLINSQDDLHFNINSTISSLHICGQFYKASPIVIYESRVGITKNTSKVRLYRVINNACRRFIILVTASNSKFFLCEIFLMNNE